MKKINLSGQVFNRLTVISEAGKSISGKIMWLCRCVCGNEKAVDGSALKSGNTQSCGCQKSEFLTTANSTHMMSKTGIYAVWCGMKGRCLRAGHKDYSSYGGRGISVCERWVNSFQLFSEDMGERPDGHSIERINNNEGYSPKNCRWAKSVEQGRNKRNTIFLQIGMEKKPLAELAELNKLKYDRVYQRKLRGATDDEALSTKHGKHTYLTNAGVTRSLTDWVAVTGIKKTTIQMRIRSGWSIEKALTKGATL